MRLVLRQLCPVQRDSFRPLSIYPKTELSGLPLLLLVTEARANAAFTCCEKTLIQFGFRLYTQCALSARGLSESNREDLGKRCPTIEGPVGKSLGTAWRQFPLHHVPSCT